MKAIARIQWRTETIGKLRVWNREDQIYSDPYYIGAYVELIGDRVLEISLLDKKIRRKHWEAIFKMCRREGIKRIFAERFRNRIRYEHIIEVK